MPPPPVWGAGGAAAGACHARPTAHAGENAPSSCLLPNRFARTCNLKLPGVPLLGEAHVAAQAPAQPKIGDPHAFPAPCPRQACRLDVYWLLDLRAARAWALNQKCERRHEALLSL